VVERSAEAFRDAFAWCTEHLSQVRRAGAFNAELIARERSWDQLAHRFGELFDGALGRGPAPSPTPAATPVADVRAEPPRPDRLRRALSRGQIPLRIAFLTPEFVTEYDTGGGLGNYLHRMTRALLEAGHVPEVFVLSREAPGPIDFGGVRVVRVRRSDANPLLQAGVRLSWRLGLHRLQPPLLLLNDARRLSSALARRDAERRFDLVQSADYLACGAFVHSVPGRPHLVRCSADGRLWADANGDTSPRRRWETQLERWSLRRADLAYAPSRFVADQLQRRYGIEVQVLRPPVALECKPRRDESHGLPERYFIHFGQLAGSKGTPDLARALPRVWEQEPAFAMVWAGPDRTGRLREWSEAWGERRSRVVWLGELTKPELYAVLAEAEAAVLPSRVDNLPNTAIESLLLGVPVIGSAGASIDELVEPGVTGELVPIGDAEALAAAMLRLWRGQSTARRGFRWSSPLAEEMRPENAVRNLLRLAGVGSEM
jgi:glycosyltransferase involved in cell wall biosynthesis